MRVAQILGMSAVLLALAGCSSSSSSPEATVPPEPRHITGVFELSDPTAAIVGDWSNCSGQSKYGPFGPGTFVGVRDGEGAVIGSSKTHALADLSGTGLAVLGQDLGHRGRDDLVSDLALHSGQLCVTYFEIFVPEADQYVFYTEGGMELKVAAAYLDARSSFVAISLNRSKG